MTSLAVPVHQVYLHQVPPFKSNDIDICTYTSPMCEDLRAGYDVSSFTVFYTFICVKLAECGASNPVTAANECARSPTKTRRSAPWSHRIHLCSPPSLWNENVETHGLSASQCWKIFSLFNGVGRPAYSCTKYLLKSTFPCRRFWNTVHPPPSSMSQ